MAISVMSACVIGCSSSDKPDGGLPDGTNEDGTQGDDDIPVNRVIRFGMPMTVDQEQAGLSLDLAASADNSFGIAYVKRGEDVYACNAPGDCPQPPPESAEWSCISRECVSVCTSSILGDDEVPIHSDLVRYAWFNGTDWSHENVASFSSSFLSTIAFRFDGSTPTLAYLGGTGGLQICGGTDVMVGRRTGAGAWNIAAAVLTSNEATAGGDCPKMQSICDFGDVVGLWPTMAIAPDGTIGIAYRDVHNGYTKEASDSSDLEWTWAASGGANWGHQWIDLARGSGLFTSLAFGPDNLPAVAFYNGKYGVLNFDRQVDGAFTGTIECGSNDDCPTGLSCIQSTGWCWNAIARPGQSMEPESISLVVAPDGRYLVAYFDPDNKNLMLAHSADGLSWQTGIIDSDGATGLYPSLVIDPQSQMPIVAYYRCSNYEPGQLNCNPNQDGPRLAAFAGAWPAELTQQNKWKKNQDLIDTADRDAAEGKHIKLAVTANGQIGIAYNYGWVDPVDGTSHQALMFRLGVWEEQ
jgi:hypothetical protein